MTDTPTDEAPAEAEPATDAAADAPADAATDTATDTATEAARGTEIVPVAAEAPAVVVEAPHDDTLQTRLLIPLLLPILAIVAVALYVLNVSRVFLAGDSTSALAIATIITVTILAGGALISATPRLRTSSLAMVMGLVVIIVISAGLTALGPSIDTGEATGGGPVAQPSGSAVGTVAVEALASIKFNSDNYTAPAGVVEIDYSGATGHTLQFRTLDYQGFPLATSGGPTKGKVELKPGEYEIYCTVDSHAQQGMVATITVTQGAPPSS
jgi:plastocyanin